MLDKNAFDPEKMALVEFKMLKSHVEIPENFDITKILGHHLENSLELSFNLDDKLAKADFTISVKTDSKGENEQEAIGSFNLTFIYRIENLGELATQKKNNRLNLNPSLASALSSITYSTSRGILLTHLQGTALQNFVLPIINPNILLHRQK